MLEIKDIFCSLISISAQKKFGGLSEWKARSFSSKLHKPSLGAHLDDLFGISASFATQVLRQLAGKNKTTHPFQHLTSIKLKKTWIKKSGTVSNESNPSGVAI